MLRKILFQRRKNDKELLKNSNFIILSIIIDFYCPDLKVIYRLIEKLDKNSKNKLGFLFFVN